MDTSGSLTLAQIAGTHITIYEAFYKLVDPLNNNHVNALDAAHFLKNSGLSQATLGKIWDLSDPTGKGYLDKKGFFVALKLIALVQSGKQPNMNELTIILPSPPKMGEPTDWSIKPNDRTKFEVKFHSMNPVDGKLSGSQVKPMMVASKLPVDLLTRIWDLSDIDQDGFLDIEEFVLAMQLITKASEKVPIPQILPIELASIKSKKSESWSAFDGPTNTGNQVQPPLPTSMIANDSFKNVHNKSTITTQWVVTASDKATYDEMFQALDQDYDGYVTGMDIKDTLIKTGLPQNVLAHIWNLCDVKENGKLNSEQFALSMFFVKNKQQGLEIPDSLSPEMVPPTLRPKPSSGLVDHTLESNTQPITASFPTSNGSANLQSVSTGNKELDSLAEELNELQMEKVKFEKELNQNEGSMKLKQSEIKNLQNEIETLHQMLKQLDAQKGEARKRLDDLGNQVENMNLQLEEQKKKIEVQESEFNSKRKELDHLRGEESQLEMKLESYRREIDSSSKSIGDTQLEISQNKTQLLEMEEFEKRLSDGISDFDTALTNNDIMKINSLLPRSITPPIIETQNQTSSNNEFESDSFAQKEGDFSSDPFAGEDPFKEDPFRNEANFSSDPFGSSGNEPFDPFGTGSFQASHDMVQSDPFGGDAFAPKPESPTPALPPKKSKPPPPRPAPPAAKSGSKTPMRAAPAPPMSSGHDDPFKSDPFGSSSHGFDAFPAGDSRDPFNSFSSPPFQSHSDSFANFDKADMPPPADPYASLASIHHESRQLSNINIYNTNKSVFGNWKDESKPEWSFVDQKKLEENRQRCLNQEKSDYEMALALSKQMNSDLNW